MKGLDRDLAWVRHYIYDLVSVSISKVGRAGHVVRRTGCSQELHLGGGGRQSGPKAFFGQAEQRPDHAAEVCGVSARSGQDRHGSLLRLAIRVRRLGRARQEHRLVAKVRF